MDKVHGKTGTGKSQTQWIWTLFIVVILPRNCHGSLENGGVITQDTTVKRYESPMLIKDDILVAEGATLTIEPGVELRFAPSVMLAVNGTLIAKGLAEDRIVFTKDPGEGQETPDWPQDVRLVDERHVFEGRLQLLYRGKWRGICANFQNWTDVDTNVTCRQLGFNGGEFSFLSWATNDTLSRYMLYHKPECTGSEDSILDCPGGKHVQIGYKICQNQQTVHLKCEGLASDSGNWWGLEFYNTTNREILSNDQTLKLNVSTSILENLDILYAGVDKEMQPVPAVRASPYPPQLINVAIKYSALDATNFTEVKTATIVHNSNIEHNRGHGLVVESHIGRLNITDSEINNNMGNGVKAKFLDGKWPIFDERDTFCQTPDLNQQRYPVIMSGIPINLGFKECIRKFRAHHLHRLMFNVLEMDIVPNAWGELIVYDGSTQSAKHMLGRFDIINGTMPQGLTSNTFEILVVFKWADLPKECPILFDCIKFTIMIESGPVTVPEIFVNNSLVHNNLQHGLFIENMRNYAFVNHSDVSYNQYGAGIRVYGGAGDVHINATNVTHNFDNGVNITYDGGYRIFNMSTFSNNYGNAINVTFNETKIDNKSRIAKHQRTEVSWSWFEYNEGFGLRVGNYCKESLAVVNDSTFTENLGNGVEFESCFRTIDNDSLANFTVGYNHFQGNYGHAVRITPLLNAVGRIGNNTFRGHQRHVVLIDNTDDFLKSRFYSTLPVEYDMSSNKFENNYGFYVVNLRLTQGSNIQKLDFKYNTLRNNVIEGAFPGTNERTRAYGVIVVSSDNVNVRRNHLVNPDSRYELATHLLERSAVIEVSHQWWGTIDYSLIIHRIFDQFNRYNLAKMDYHPVLEYDDLYGEWDTEEERPLEIEFNRERNLLGGRLAEEFVTRPDVKTYYVDRDITILPEGRLKITKGTTLEFENGLGMLNQGYMESLGDKDNKVVFKLKNETTYTNNSRVRLSEGDEGRLEVIPEGETVWGTVCNRGWTMKDASVVCQMLGYVVHPDDWYPLTDVPGYPSQPIYRSMVDCTELDMDLTKCAADGELDHSCDHSMDVSVRCKPPTWAGVHFLATAQPSVMRHTIVTGAGLLDPTLMWYAPAIKIDYNLHTLENLNVTHSMSTGIEIMRNDIYIQPRIKDSTISHNLGNGISIRSPFFDLEFCHIHSNFRNGFEYNPHYTTYEAQQLRAGIHGALVIDDELARNGWTIPNEGFRFIVTEVNAINVQKTYDVEIRVNVNHRVVVDIIDWNPEEHEEKVTVFDSYKVNIQPSTFNWKIEEDLVEFPVVSTGTAMTIRWEVRGPTSGRTTFLIRSKPYDREWPWPDLKIRNITVENNRKGIVTRHYNQPSNEYLDLFFRYRWQQIYMYGVNFLRNTEEALHVPSITKYHELYMPTFEELQFPHRMTEITYQIESCHILENGGGIKGEHNHVEFSNNVWIWEVTGNVIEWNKRGGYDIELPKVNLMYSEIFNHSVDVNDTIFENNQQFEFRIDGFYCNSSIARNRFQGNRCLLGCISITGTEKDIDIHDNEILENYGKYMMEFNMNSHTPYTRWVDAYVTYNNFKRNKKLDDSAPSWTSSPTSYTLGVKGVQNITLNRNLFSNELDFELVAGQSSSELENYLDVTENYWGSEDQEVIQKKIFDFDDWNNYAIAEYYPYLLYDNFASALSNKGKLHYDFDVNKPLGGRIEGAVSLGLSGSPYIVASDITVMPMGSLFIDAGVELKFYPNVGILVLGSMTARGYLDQKIKFNPIDKNELNMIEKKRKKRQLEPGEVIPEHKAMRLTGGPLSGPDEGFLEVYNATERRWTLICDNHFNDETAEVACRTMGKESSNVLVETNSLYDHFVLGYPIMHEQKIEWFWRETLICDGSETKLDQCRYRINYQLFTCMEKREYVFVRCGARNLAENFDYWGNVRFSSPEYEHGSVTAGYSLMEHADIYGAGILHEERAAAVQAVYRTPEADNVRITNCAWNGYDFIAPKDEFWVSNGRIENNNGYGVGGLVLNGDSQDELKSSFKPLNDSIIPYNVYGTVRMCTSEKLIYVKDRVLLYFKYDFQTVDCIKILRSREPTKQISVRFLQLKLYNDTFYKNAVEMYNGEFFVPELKIGEVTPNSTEHDREIRYVTDPDFDNMGIRITASPAHGIYGFIAEVVTLPQSPGWRPDPDEAVGFRQRIVNSALTGNLRGGFHFMNAGELNPSVIIESNRIQQNGYTILNITSAPVMYLNVQNSRLMTIANNYVGDNAGGIEIVTNTESLATAIYCNISNNVIVHNTHGPNLQVVGHHYQDFDVRRNYIAHNKLEFHNNIAMFGIHLNFASNIVFDNKAQCTINASVPEKVSINQNFFSNAIYDNYAYANNKSTIFLRSAKTKFENNYLQNWLNIYEMVTFNRTRYPEWDAQYPSVNAQKNWWGSPNEFFVSGRIWDRKDDDNLIRVDYANWHKSNTSIPSVVQGLCRPGWRYWDREDKCYLYMGGALPHNEAKKLCSLERGTLAIARDRHQEVYIGELILSMQPNYNEHWRTWIYRDFNSDDKCIAIINYKTYIQEDCGQLLPVVCETDPYAKPKLHWKPIHIALGVVGGILFVVFILIGCAILKGRQRTDSKIERRNSLRRSIRQSKQTIYSNKHAMDTTMTSTRSLGGGTTSAYTPQGSMSKRRRPQLGRVPRDDSGMLNLSGYTGGETSTDSIDKYKLGMDSHRPGTPETLEYSSQSQSGKMDASSYFDSDLQEYYPHRLENEIAQMMHRPHYDTNVFMNDAYDDRSLDRSEVHPVVSPYQRRMPHETSTSSEFMDQTGRPQRRTPHYSESMDPPPRPQQHPPYSDYADPPPRPEQHSSPSDYMDQPRPQGHTPRSKPPRPKPKETAM